MAKLIPLSRGLFATVDDEDFERVRQFKWHAIKGVHTFYAAYQPGRSSCIFLHRFILNALPHQRVDHRDTNGLNNRKKNLRVATNAQNQCNRGKNKNSTSPFKGVYWNKRLRKWTASIGYSRKHIHLGVFDFPEAAAHAYDVAAIKYHGEFAKTNF